MFFLNIQMYMLLIIMASIVYAMVAAVGASMGIGAFQFYVATAFIIMFLQYMFGPKLVEWSMRVKYVNEREYPELFTMMRNLSRSANMPMPKIGISEFPFPNAFAFGRWKSDGRICVTRGILGLLDRNELRAVLGHEMSHLKNRDVVTITLLSVIPLLLYRIAFHLLFFGGSRRRNGGNAMLIGVAALVFYFITNLLVLYASRIREYFADRGSIKLGNPPHHLASALYKLVYGSARMTKEATREVEGLKAFFVNDPSRALTELNELKQIDIDRSGTIDASELIAVRAKELRLSAADKLMEVFSTHPNMLKRIKRLSQYEHA